MGALPSITVCPTFPVGRILLESVSLMSELISGSTGASSETALLHTLNIETSAQYLTTCYD